MLPDSPTWARHRLALTSTILDALPTVAASGELALRLPVAMHTLADRQRPASERAIALAWLIHLVADAHQPLHTASRFDADGHGDEGGNRQWIEDPSIRAAQQHVAARLLGRSAGPALAARGPALERAVDAMAGARPTVGGQAAAPGIAGAMDRRKPPAGEDRGLRESTAKAEISRAYNTRALQTAGSVAQAGTAAWSIAGVCCRATELLFHVKHCRGGRG